jgi:hypothetical protein
VQYAPMVILLGDTDHVAASVAGDSGGARTHLCPPLRWFTRAPKHCAETRSSGMAASPCDYQKQ